MGEIQPANLKLQDKNGKDYSGADVLSGKVILYYFSAHWCPPCRKFTPNLKKWYAAAKDANKNIVCVFVSWDNDEKRMLNYFTHDHGDYFAVKFDTAEREKLGEQYSINAIPRLVVVKDNGDLIKPNARDDIKKTDLSCIDKWV